MALFSDETVRLVGNFSPSLWGHQFLNFTFDNKIAEKYSKEIELLKDEVKTKLTNPERKMVDTMNLIDVLERLGISYHFEDEIKYKLEQYFGLNTNYEDDNYDLSNVSVHFRLFRQHGLHLTSEIFSKFKGRDGKFKESLKSDIRGLLSLYEAAHLRKHNETILDDALVFTKECLKSMDPNLKSPLKTQVEHALMQPLHLGYPRFESYHYICVYEEDEYSRDESLLKFAKLDYNAVQMLHKQELCEVSRWWRDLNIMSKLPYARDRLVECYFWATGAYHLPKYSRGRVMLTKIIKLLSLIDDTFDVYGTSEELDAFTIAIQRWDIKEIDLLPEYMKPLYTVILNLYDEFKEEQAKKERSYAVDHTISALKEQVRSYNVEAKWFLKGYLPPFSEYLNIALTTGTYHFLSNASLMVLDFATRKEFEWLNTMPKILGASLTICRLVDDVATYKVEKERCQKSTGIDCYMKDYGVTMEEAMNKIEEMATDAWKDVNENFKRPFPCSKEVLMIILNITRVIDVVYKNNEDGYTHPEKVIKPLIVAMYIEPFKI
ncbi:germacrene A synthase-like isoform X2 [Primulina huaijiensis]|uniref:germacrene A synthase-like isoform X2 n=1 Tax=Primulina huaijiensis TaxID=1492673 RepID=UPI003CC766B4